MEGGPRKWARAGAREEILDAGEGLFATKRFQKGEEILDYRYIGGKEVRGDEVEWLTAHARAIPTEIPAERRDAGGRGNTRATLAGKETYIL